MIRAILLSLALLAAPAYAQDDHDDHDHDHHVAEAEGIRAIHGWANAGDGSSAFVYIELENTSGEAVILSEVESDIAASAELVGLANSGGELSFQPIAEMPITAGSSIVLSPNALAIRLSGLTGPLVEGETFEIEFGFGGTHLHAVVEIESASATQHSHAGHNH